MVGAKIKPMFEKEARERQRGGQGSVLLPANLPEANKESRELAAEAVNVSPHSEESARAKNGQNCGQLSTIEASVYQRRL